MEVLKTEEPAGTLKKIELINTGEENFKVALIAWIGTNYPDWGYKGFYDRLVTFRADSCTLDLTVVD